jgi:5-methyltetrahydrofolate--homocysteine methyltransferase
VYSGAVVHVSDASKSVPIAGESISPETRDSFRVQLKETYRQLRVEHEAKQTVKQLISYTEAKQNPVSIQWEGFQPVAPKVLGRTVLEDLDLNVLREYIDWTPFFSTWMLAGKYPKILSDTVVGEEATQLFAEAQTMLDTLIKEKWLSAKAAFSLFPVQREEDDAFVLDEKGNRVASFHFLRQQGKKGKDVPNRSLADYLHPNEVDYLGCFAVTAGLGMETKLAEFKAAGDDYNDILFKALADRLAEAATEYVHEQVRTNYWGHSTTEKLDNEALIKEEYLGIRPAPGYPACPEHSEKVTISELLDLENTVGITLTSSYAMYPTSSVSGFFFAHPESSYFGLGKIGEDQVESYATRKGITLQEAERLLSPNLAYSPTPILENSIL